MRSKFSFRINSGAYLKKQIVNTGIILLFTILFYFKPLSSQGQVNLGSASDYAILAQDSIIINDTIFPVGKVGASIIPNSIMILPTDTNDSNYAQAVSDLQSAVTTISGLSGSTIGNNLDGLTLSAGVYEITGNCTLTQIVTLSGDENSIFIFKISGDFNCSSFASVNRTKVLGSHIYWKIGGDFNGGDFIKLSGNIIAEGNINIGTNSFGPISLLTLQSVRYNFNTTIFSSTENFFYSNLRLSNPDLTSVTNCNNPPFDGCNFVPNHSFEDNNICPDNLSEITYTCGWNLTIPNTGTTDLYNSCAPAIPLSYVSAEPTGPNLLGDRLPHTGNGYAGIIAGPYDNYREYIQQELFQPLNAGTLYYVEYFASNAEGDYWSIDQLGAYFSILPLNNTGLPALINVTPQIESPAGLVLLIRT